jgi:ABC-type nitrate/sulfonate/bicarbonate transport system substrate-binding protein
MTSFSRRDLAKGGMALAGGALVRPRPARAAAKVRLLTNWFAEAEHGGFYQAAAAGLYDKTGLDVDTMTQFSRDLGILEGHPAFEEIVAVQFADLWQGQPG